MDEREGLYDDLDSSEYGFIADKPEYTEDIDEVAEDVYDRLEEDPIDELAGDQFDKHEKLTDPDKEFAFPDEDEQLVNKLYKEIE